MPEVSIIVPVYNAEKGIRRCVDSILHQQYTEFELLLVDDGSKDESGKILDGYAEKDPRVKVFHNTNHGVSYTRNFALKKAKGTYVQFVDADDEISDDSTKQLVRTMQDTNADLVVGDFWRVVKDPMKKDGWIKSQKGSIKSNEVMTLQEYASLMMDSPSDYYYGVLWNKLYRNSILQEYGVIMDEDVSFAEDFIFNLEYLLHVKTVVALQTPVYLYYKTEGSLVSSVSLSKVVAMKTNVFTYYNDFYRNILDEKQYRHDRLAIAGFLFDAAQDQFTLPFLPGTSKVGKEDEVPFISEHANAATFAYYSNELMERYLSEAARKYDLKMDDIKVLAAIHYGTSFTMSGISDFTGLSSMNIAASVSRLIMRKYLKPVVHLKDSAVETGAEAAPVLEAIEQSLQDYEDCLMEGFSSEERSQFLSFEKRMNANISRRLGNGRS